MSDICIDDELGVYTNVFGYTGWSQAEFTVQDSDLSPLEDRKVILLGRSPLCFLGARFTDDDGKCTFTNILDDSNNIIAVALGVGGFESSDISSTNISLTAMSTLF